MPEPLEAASSPPPTRAAFWERLLALIVLVAIAASILWFLSTPTGQQWRHPRTARAIMLRHGEIAPLIFLGVYLLLAVLALPIWWLQFLAGYCFGLWFGILWCEMGAAAGAVASMMVSRWLLSDWFHRRVEARLEKLRRLDETLGHNGFLVVMTCRLMHFIPFGISNYVFGLTHITVLDVLLGTLLGSIPAVASEAGVGSGIHRNWAFITILATVNVLLLAPIVLRYLFPRWFKKIGVE